MATRSIPNETKTIEIYGLDEPDYAFEGLQELRDWWKKISKTKPKLFAKLNKKGVFVCKDKSGKIVKTFNW